jgi:hypothetical protein
MNTAQGMPLGELIEDNAFFNECKYSEGFQEALLGNS